MTDGKINELALKFQKRGSARSFERLVDLLEEYFRGLHRKQGERQLLRHLDLYDDFHQECLLGLFKATQDYSLRRGSFLGFAKLVVRRHLITITMGNTK